MVSKEKSKLLWLCDTCKKSLKSNQKNIQENEVINNLIKENKLLHMEIRELAIKEAILIEKIKVMVPNDVKSSENLKQNFETPKTTYSEVLVLKRKNPDIKYNIKENLITKIDPTKLKVNIQSVQHNNTNGNVTVHCEDKTSKESLLQAINQEIGSEVTIQDIKQENIKKRIEFIANITVSTLPEDNNELIEKLIDKNNISRSINNFTMKIIYRKKIRLDKAELIVLEVDKETYKYIMESRKKHLFIDWESIVVKNHIKVIQCYKCQNYGHISKNCTKSECCMNCSGQHNSKECTNKEKKICTNCVYRNKKNNSNMKTDHCANDRNCPLYSELLKKLKQRFGYD
jgi:hypothetical protein